MNIRKLAIATFAVAQVAVPAHAHLLSQPHVHAGQSVLLLLAIACALTFSVSLLYRRKK